MLINVCESIYRREKLRCFFTFRWGRKKRSHDKPDGANDNIQLNCCSESATSQVEQEKTLTRTLIRDKKIHEYAVIVVNLHKEYDDSAVVRGIDFAIKPGNNKSNFTFIRIKFEFFHI